MAALVGAMAGMSDQGWNIEESQPDVLEDPGEHTVTSADIHKLYSHITYLKIPTIQLGRDDAADFTIPLLMAWRVAESIKSIGAEKVRDIALLGAIIARGSNEVGKYTLSVRNSTEIVDVILKLTSMAPIEGSTEEDRLLSFCYYLLKERHIDRKNAARFASMALRREIKTNTWTQRVNRWQRSRELPEVGLRARKKA
jgi:hypothetical protein